MLGSLKSNYEESNIYLKRKIVKSANSSSTAALNKVIFTSLLTKYKENMIDILFLITLISCIIAVVKLQYKTIIF